MVDEDVFQPSPSLSARTIRGLLSGLIFMTACGPSDLAAPLSAVELGEELFHDTALSQNQTLACATCHDPERGHVDRRTDPAGSIRPVSEGDDGVSFGGRNAPSIRYAFFAPPFSKGTRERVHKQSRNRTYEGYLGGFFWDGRAATLDEQAAGPLLNRIEMGMQDEASVVARVDDNPRYARSFRSLFGDEALDEPVAGFAAMTEVIAVYEQEADVFAPFDSKYDRSLRNEAQLSFKELTGKALFFSEFANCGICHQLHAVGDPVNKTREPFTSFEYHNVGVPPNAEAQALSGVAAPDVGLAANPAIDPADRPGARGKFKVPTLRNVAVTGPYMHNGVFRELRTTVEFYAHFIDPEGRALNPETGAPWRSPEVPDTVARDLLRVGDKLTDLQIESLTCFLRTLTDARYEHLIPDEPGVDCAD
jgi:cytochrome c peroxidase